MKHMFFVLSVLAFILSARVLLYSLKVASDATKNEISAIPYLTESTIKPPQMIILIHSGAAFREQRDRQRNVCVPEYKDAGIPHFFVVGIPSFDDRRVDAHSQGQLPTVKETNVSMMLLDEYKMYGDIWVTPNRDYYRDMNEKLLGVLKYGVEKGADYIIKPDDDYCVSLAALNQTIINHEKEHADSELYAGTNYWVGTEYQSMQGPHGETSPFMSGAIIVISRKLAEILVGPDWVPNVLRGAYGTSSDDANLGKMIDRAKEEHNVSVNAVVNRNMIQCNLWRHNTLAELFQDCHYQDLAKKKSTLVKWSIDDTQALNSPMSSPEKWIILLEVNTGYFELFQNWLAHFLLLQLGIKVIVIAEDDMVKEKIDREVIPIYPHQFVVNRADLKLDSTPLDWDTLEYKKMVSARATHILSKLETGVNVIYSDVDTVWRSSPLPYLAATNKADMIIEVDASESQGFSPFYCTGFMAIVSNKRTIQFMKDWQKALKHPQLNQPIFNEILHKRSNISHQPLPAMQFPSGALYFHQFSEKERGKAVIVHANYMVGISSRKESFHKHTLWMINKTVTPSFYVRLVNSTSNERVYEAKLDSDQIIQLKEDKKPIFAIIAATRSRKDWNLVSETPLQKHLIQSLSQSVTAVEASTWDIHLFVAVDNDDMFWVDNNNMQQLRIPSWLTLTFGFFPPIPNHIPFNDIAQVAYRRGAEYFCRVNDDSDFVTAGWITLGVTALQHFEPPNLGVVGPTCHHGPQNIFTHDMVHRTHMDIFHHLYYPPQFHNWYLDDWITFQYQKKTLGVDRSMRVRGWEIRHWLSGPRYKPDTDSGKLLPEALVNGRRDILHYLQIFYANHPTTLEIKNMEHKRNKTKHQSAETKL
jgi:hypothetical protein